MRSGLALGLPALLLTACFTGGDDGNATVAATETGDGDGDSPGVCGDGVVDPGEDCDDANEDNTDACLFSCVAASCGDGVVWTGNEECDDANTDDDDACPSTCVPATCGDGFVWAGNEDCDDGNADNTDACLDTCELASCGDGFVATDSEDCDDGNADNTDACLDSCVAASCGDGFLFEGTERCEDGNTNDLDGCSAGCEVELYSRCEGVGPGSCAPIDILVLVAGDDEQEFRAQIAAITGGTVDYFDARTEPPSLAELEPAYDCVFTHASQNYADAAALADTLVSFIDNGGNLVLGVGTGMLPPLGFAGTPLADEAYMPVTTGPQVALAQQFYSGDGLTVIHDNVESYAMGITDPEVTLQGRGMQDGSYESGVISAAYRPDFKLVYLNGTGAFEGFGEGDWAQLAANACAAGFIQ